MNSQIISQISSYTFSNNNNENTFINENTNHYDRDLQTPDIMKSRLECKLKYRKKRLLADLNQGNIRKLNEDDIEFDDKKILIVLNEEQINRLTKQHQNADAVSLYNKD